MLCVPHGLGKTIVASWSNIWCHSMSQLHCGLKSWGGRNLHFFQQSLQISDRKDWCLNFYFAPQFLQNGGLLAPNHVFLWEHYSTRRKRKLNRGGGNFSSKMPLLWALCISVSWCVCSNTGSVQWFLSDLWMSNTYSSTAQSAFNFQCQRSVLTYLVACTHMYRVRQKKWTPKVFSQFSQQPVGILIWNFLDLFTKSFYI